jgi:hypothetical protein
MSMTGLQADGTSTTTAHVTWPAATGATSYEVTRLSPAHPIGSAEILTAGTNELFDSGLTANTVYVYRVRAMTGSGATAVYSEGYSNYDVATTKTFTSLSGPTFIRAAIFREVRDMINAMRAAAGLPPGVFPSLLQSGAPVLRGNITQLRTALGEVRSVLGLPAIAYGENIVAGVTAVKKTHIVELRGGVQ